MSDMDPMDKMIFNGQFPPRPSEEQHLTESYRPGYSYYWDCRASGLGHQDAVRRAAKYMGAALSSLDSIMRQR